MSWLGSFIDFATDLIPGGGLIDAGIGAIGDALGGGGATRCPNQLSDHLVAAALQNAPAEELNRLRSEWYATHPNGEPFPSSPAALALHAAGGSDCKNSSSGGKRFEQVFRDFVNRWGYQTVAPAPNLTPTPSTSPAPAVGSSGGGWSGGASYTPDGGLQIGIGYSRDPLGGIPWWAWAAFALALVLVMRGKV